MRTPDDTASTRISAPTRAAERGRSRGRGSGRDAPPGRANEGELVLERYRLERRIGAGGFGVVWSGHDEKLEREVAIKVVHRDDGAPADTRVGREALAAARLNHPGIVALYELGSDDHDHYLVSELVHGATLATLRRDGAVSDRDAARIGHALCDALAHAHARGVVHRDVKPGNVMVLAEPAAGSGFAKLTDFGIAHLATGEGITATGDVLGTLAYMAPEQAEGGRVSGACDVYSLALTLYEVWTGTNPVRGASPAATARRVGRRLPELGQRRPDLPAELCETVDAALDPDPELRPAPAELGEVLGRCAGMLGEQGGLVEPATRERFGLTAATVRRPLLGAVTPRRSPGTLEAALRRVGPRLGSGVATAALVFAALSQLDGGATVQPGLPALIAGAATALLPRIGWLVSAFGVCVWLASGTAEGTALVLAAALVPTPLLLWRAPELWSVPALAPLLGLASLAAIFPGVAALAPTVWRRAGLGAAGALWLLAGELVLDRRLLFGLPDGVTDPTAWMSSGVDAADHALWPVLQSGALAVGGVWLVAAVLFGLLVRGRWAAIDLVFATAWAVGLVAAQTAVGQLVGADASIARGAGPIIGAALGALIAVTVTLGRPPESDDPQDPALP